MIRTSLPIISFSQTEQTGGFWLISLKLSVDTASSQPESQPDLQPPSPPFDTGCLFGFSTENLSLLLFQQTVSGTEISLQLLSEQAIPADLNPTALFVQEPDVKNLSDKDLQSFNNLLILGSGLAMANLFYLAKQRSSLAEQKHTIALLHSQQGFPFAVKPALFMTPDLPAEAIGCSTLLEDWQITNRLASDLGLPGCFDGEITELFAIWADNQSIGQPTGQSTDQQWQVIACLSSEQQKKCLEISQAYSWLDFIGIQYPTL